MGGIMFDDDMDFDELTEHKPRGKYLYNYKQSRLLKIFEFWGSFALLLLVAAGTVILMSMLP